MFYSYVETPAGTMLLIGDGQKVTGMHWKVFKRAPIADPSWIEDRSVFSGALRQLDEYFAGTRRTFDFAYAPSGTPFQLSVWQELAKIPYGEKRSYLDIATAIGKPRAVRAVGTAVGSNPISIVIPCHRVLGTNSRLHGYAGGLASKQRLLELEKIPFML